jgi:hypothetical protein
MLAMVETALHKTLSFVSRTRASVGFFSSLLDVVEPRFTLASTSADSFDCALEDGLGQRDFVLVPEKKTTTTTKKHSTL